MQRLILTLCVLGLLTAPQARADSISGGQTTVTLDSSFINLLTTNSIVPSAIAPATLIGDVATFPITGGTANGGNLVIDHSGGLKFTDGSEFLSIGDFVVDTLNSDVTGFATNNAGLNVASAQLFTIGPGLSLDLSATAATAISDTFFGGNSNVTSELTGFNIGVAAPSPVVTPEPESLILFATGTMGLAGMLYRRLPSRS